MQSPVTEYKPGKSLSSFVELFWSGSFHADASGRLSLQMIPNGCIELIIHLNDLHCDLENKYGWKQSPDFMILGLFTQPYEVRVSGLVKVFASRFKPEGFYNIDSLFNYCLYFRVDSFCKVLRRDSYFFAF